MIYLNIPRTKRQETNPRQDRPQSTPPQLILDGGVSVRTESKVHVYAILNN